ncbi:MAG TPA: hypothetical protein VNZ49_13240 [Bacteroidia bacterium]|jgi:hypothetical protein|nr:hypothetical protein [Bacteroidia bacterium]
MKGKFIYIALLFSNFIFAQLPKSPDMAVLSFVKKGNIQLRWAPGNENLWKTGNLYGYKVERISFDQYMEGGADSVKFKNAVQLNSLPLMPWKKDDERWKSLLAKNKSASFLLASLYSSNPKTTFQKQEMIFGMSMKSCDLYKELSVANGLYICYSTFNENEVYVYRVSLWNVPKNIKYTSAIIAVNPKELSALQKIETLNAKFGDRKVILNFVTKTIKDYAGYWIERSEDSINYKIVNKSPFIRSTTKYDEGKSESVYGDSIPANNKKFYYRIRGISYFGELSKPSNLVSGKGKPDFNEYPFIDSTVIVKNNSVLLKFHMAESFDKSLLKSFFVLRSEKKGGNYTCISKALPSETILFSDTQPLETNYYKICAINVYNDSSFSMVTYAKLIDETPPAVPVEPTGTIDSNGVIRITWAINTDKDLLGYRVYRCNSLKEQPFELTRKILTQNTFKDSVSLKTLTKEIFYTLRAVDKVYNNSDYSKYCKLIRPDKIKPVAIVFRKITPTDSSIILNWHNSSSNDVKKYKLYKKENSADWKFYKEWLANENRKQFSDSNLIPENSYQYKIETVDESGNNSFTETHFILFKPLFLPGIKNFKSIVSLETRSIELFWELKGKTIYNYTLYKAKANDPLRIYKTLDAKTANFIDKELYPNNKYRYGIKATFNSGAETKLSEVIEVEF